MYFVIIVFLFVITKSDEKALVLVPTSLETNLTQVDKPHPVIIDGHVATMKDYPYAVRLYIRRSNVMTFCTGQAVHVNLILTAAHCVKFESKIIVVTGKANQQDYVAGKNVDEYARYLVTDKYIHPDFSSKEYTHDIALLRTSRRMTHRNFAAVPISYEALQETAQARIYGWGQNGHGQTDDQLYGKSLKVESCNLDCQKGDPRYICLKEPGINHGDSGGGLIINDTIFGVASFYNPLSPPSHRYYYTAIAKEAEFVRNCIQKNGSNYSPYSNWFFLFFLLVTYYFL